MIGGILLALAWFFLFFLLALIVQQLAEVRMLLESWLKTYHEGFVDLPSVEETKDVEEPKESDQEKETNEETSDA
jgi:hypothetical protein